MSLNPQTAEAGAARATLACRLRAGALLIGFALAACASGQETDPVGNEDSVEARQRAAARHAELDPRLRPDWTSRHHFPPEYCWYVSTMDEAHPLYWDIRRFCDAKRGRGRFR